MKEYSIYWVKEEFAKHYFYKSDMLYRFFKVYLLNKERIDLSLQFEYITNVIPCTSIISRITENHHTDTICRVNEHEITLCDDSIDITLHIYKKHIKFRCESLQDAEKLLFPRLRTLYPFLFIIDHNFDNFGWISPVSTSMIYNEQEVLYSY